jgi:hypothetical protein
VKRLDRRRGKVVWKAWPAFFSRAHDGRLLFFEGHIVRPKALSDLGVEWG